MFFDNLITPRWKCFQQRSQYKNQYTEVLTVVDFIDCYLFSNQQYAILHGN